MIQSYPGWFTNLCLLFWRGNRFTDNCQHFYRREHLFLVRGNNTLDAVQVAVLLLETLCIVGLDAYHKFCESEVVSNNYAILLRR